MKRSLYVDEDGRLHVGWGTKKPPIDLHWEIRAAVLCADFRRPYNSSN